MISFLKRQVYHPPLKIYWPECHKVIYDAFLSVLKNCVKERRPIKISGCFSCSYLYLQTKQPTMWWYMLCDVNITWKYLRMKFFYFPSHYMHFTESQIVDSHINDTE